MRKNSWLVWCLLVMAMPGCKEKSQHPLQGMSNAEMKELLIESSKHHAGREDQLIEDFVSAQPHAYTKSSTGLRYRVLSEPREETCDTIETEQLVLLNYVVELLDGTLCYFSKPGEPRSFVVDHDDVESGLHEGVKNMCAGDSAVFILPSHLAHGLTGDQRKIPSNSPIVYRIKVISAK